MESFLEMVEVGWESNKDVQIEFKLLEGTHYILFTFHYNSTNICYKEKKWGKVFKIQGFTKSEN